MPGNISIEKSKCDSPASNSVNGNSVSKLFYGLLNSKSGLDLIRSKKCQQATATTTNPQLRRSFKLLKAHRSESNLPFNKQSASSNNDHLNHLNNYSNQFNEPQLSKQSKPILTGSLGDLKMKSNDSTLLTTAQVATVIADDEQDDESRPPTPPIRNTSLLESLRPSNAINNQLLASYPNYNRELPSLPTSKSDEKRKSISFSSRLSPISDDGGFNSFDFNASPNKRNSISVLNHRNFSNHQHPNNYRNNLINQNNHLPNNLINGVNKYGALINSTTPSTSVFHSSSSSNNLSNAAFADKWHNNLPPTFDNNMFNQRNSYFSDVDQHLDLDYQNINANANNYALGSQKSDNWSSSTSVLSTYTGITSSSTSDYYTASSETITNSPSLSSLNSAICSSSMNTCNSPPLNGKQTNNLNKHYSGSSLVNHNNKNMSYMRQFCYPGSQMGSTSATTKLAKSPALPNTGIAISSLVEKPKRQESASVLYYIVAKDAAPTTNGNEFPTVNSDLNAQTKEQLEQQVVDKENLHKNKLASLNDSPSPASLFNNNNNRFPSATNNNFVNYNNSMPINENYLQPQPQNQTDLKAIQKSLHEFYLRHRGASKDSQVDHQPNETTKEQNQFNKNLINYSLTSNDSACSDDSSTVSPSDSPTLFPNLPTIQLPAKPSFLNMIKKLTPEEEQRLSELKANAIYTNIHFDSLGEELMKKEDGLTLQNASKELRLSFRERCSPFENKNSTKQTATENKTKNELKILNQPNSVKNIAKQFDNLSTLNCDLNANRVSPISINKSATENGALNSSHNSNSSSNSTMKSQETERLVNGEKSIESPSTEASDKNNLEHLESKETDQANEQMNEEDLRLRLRTNEEKIKLFLDYLNKNEMSKADYNKILQHIEDVDKVTKLVLSLTSRLNKIEGILQLRNSQQNSELNGDQTNDSQLLDSNKYKQSTSTDSLLDEKNLFSSILSLSSISLNNLNCNSTAFFASIEMLNSKKNKILDQLEEATQLKQMIERRCKNLNERIIGKRFDFTKIDFETQENTAFTSLKGFNFIDSMQDKHHLSLRCRELEQCARSTESSK